MDEVNAVVLDIDGTLLLSNEAHARSYVDAASTLGLASNFESILRLIGKGSDKLIPEAFGFDSESDLGKSLDTLKAKVFKARYLSTLQPAPGARDGIPLLRGENLRLQRDRDRSIRRAARPYGFPEGSGQGEWN